MDKNALGMGSEGIPTQFSDWSLQPVTTQDLTQALVAVASTIDPAMQPNLMERVTLGLITQELGQGPHDAKKALEGLRALDDAQKSLDQKLLQRTLSLLSYDGLNPLSVGTVHPLTIYRDLHIAEPALQPLATYARGDYPGAERDLTFPLYQDGNRRIKLHVYGYGGTGITTDDGPHEHYGVCASLVLHGSLINTHYETQPVAEGQPAEYGLYRMEKAKASFPEKSKVVFNKVNDVRMSPITLHAYDAGDHYYLPAPNGHRDVPAEVLSAQERLYMHTAKAMANTATLFTQDVSDQTALLTTFPVNAPPEIDKASADVRTPVPQEQTTRILADMDLKIQESLASIIRMNTPYDRAEAMGTRETFTTRLQQSIKTRQATLR